MAIIVAHSLELYGYAKPGLLQALKEADAADRKTGPINGNASTLNLFGFFLQIEESASAPVGYHVVVEEEEAGQYEIIGFEKSDFLFRIHFNAQQVTGTIIVAKTRLTRTRGSGREYRFRIERIGA